MGLRKKKKMAKAAEGFLTFFLWVLSISPDLTRGSKIQKQIDHQAEPNCSGRSNIHSDALRECHTHPTQLHPHRAVVERVEDPYVSGLSMTRLLRAMWLNRTRTVCHLGGMEELNRRAESLTRKSEV